MRTITFEERKQSSVTTDDFYTLDERVRECVLADGTILNGTHRMSACYTSKYCPFKLVRRPRDYNACERQEYVFEVKE